MLTYIAGKWTARRRIRRWAEKVNELPNYSICSSWLTCTKPFPPVFLQAVKDHNEVQRASLLILDTLDKSETGGREVEFGLALGDGCIIYIVGPNRNIFHTMATKQFDTWPKLMEHLRVIGG